MINTSSLDTSLAVRVLTRDDEKKCRKVLELLASGCSFMFSDFALYETVYVLETVYDKPRGEVVDLINFFLTRYDDVIQYNHALTETVFPFFLAHPKLSFGDCCLAATAELEGAEPLFTFDKKLAQQHPSAKLL